MTAQAMIGFGQVHHARLRPVQHAFNYPTFFLLLPLRSLRAAAEQEARTGVRKGGWACNQRHAISFHDVDHGDARAPAQGGALAWLDALLHSEGIHDATGEAWLHT